MEGKHLYFGGDRTVEVVSGPVAEPGPGQVRLRIEAAGVCGSDLHYLFRVPSSERGKPRLGVSIDPNVAPGHEPAGVVESIGDGVTSLAVGQRVVVHHISGCGDCDWCTRDLPMHCADKQTYGFDIDGSFSEYMVAEARDCIEVPDGLSLTDASYCACGAGTAFNALVKLQTTARDVVAITGLGPVGLAAVLFAKSFGAPVVAIDLSEERRKLAVAAGADVVLDPTSDDVIAEVRALTGGRGATVGVDCSGSAPGRSLLLDVAALLGRIAFVGEGGTAEMNVSEQVIHKQLTIIGSWVFGISELRHLMEYVADRDIDLASIVTHTYPIDQAQEAFNVADAADSGKVVITMGGN